MEIKKYDIVLVNLSQDAFGNEQDNSKQKLRPCVVIQNDDGNKFSPTTIIMELSTAMKGLHLPVHEIIYKSETTGLKKDSIILGEQMRTIDKRRIVAVVGSIVSDRAKKAVAKVYFSSFGQDYLEVESLQCV